MFLSTNLRATLALACLLVPASVFAAAPSPSASPFDISAAALLKSAPTAAQFPDASFIALRDESVTHLNADGSGTDVTHLTIKIFNERGRAAADVSIPYNTSTDKISNVHARTIKADGTVLEAGPGDIHETSPFSSYAMYDDAKVTGISMPGVENGAIIDYVYTRTTLKSYLPGQFSVLWSFQDGANPVKLSRLILTAPVGLAIHTRVHNADGMNNTKTLSKDGKEETYVWQMADRGSLVPEPMMPPARTFLPWMEVSTVPSWQTISHWYQGLASGQMAVSPEIRETVKTLTAGKTTDTEKAKAIYYWVEGQTRYVALELGLSAFQPHAATAVCRNRYGDCKDMATLLITMLHEAGIKTAWPVLLGAGSNDPVHEYLAAPSFFNHAIVRADIDGKPYWFDSTAEMCPFGQIPGGDRGVDAFVVRNGVGTFEMIPMGAEEANLQTTKTTINLHADGSADCETTVHLVGDQGLGTRIAFRGLQVAQVKPGFQNMVSRFSPDASLTDYSLSSLADRDTPVEMDIKYHAPLWATKTGHLLILNGKDMTTAPYDRSTRTFPMYANSLAASVEDTIITLPDGYTLEDKPDDFHETTPLGDYTQTVTRTGNTLAIHLAVTSKPGTIAPADYAAAKALQEKVVAIRKQPIVLKQTAVN